VPALALETRGGLAVEVRDGCTSGTAILCKAKNMSEGRVKVWQSRGAAVEAGGNVAGLGVRGEGNLQCDSLLRWMWTWTLFFSSVSSCYLEVLD
jgi:hypothetical protein